MCGLLWIDTHSSAHVIFKWWRMDDSLWHWTTGNMVTSSNGNIFHVTGPLCGEFTGHRWIPLTKTSDAELWCFEPWINGWVNNREAGDLRRRHAHYGVIVMIFVLPCGSWHPIHCPHGYPDDCGILNTLWERFATLLKQLFRMSSTLKPEHDNGNQSNVKYEIDPTT